MGRHFSKNTYDCVRCLYEHFGDHIFTTLNARFHLDNLGMYYNMVWRDMSFGSRTLKRVERGRYCLTEKGLQLARGELPVSGDVATRQHKNTRSRKNTAPVAAVDDLPKQIIFSEEEKVLLDEMKRYLEQDTNGKPLLVQSWKLPAEEVREEFLTHMIDLGALSEVQENRERAQGKLFRVNRERMKEVLKRARVAEDEKLPTPQIALECYRKKVEERIENTKAELEQIKEETIELDKKEAELIVTLENLQKMFLIFSQAVDPEFIAQLELAVK